MQMQFLSEAAKPKSSALNNPDMDICGLAFETYLERVKAFHGFTAPGVVLGGVMVDAARRRLPQGILFDALCESAQCLPDAVQLLTPCTAGNGWLKIVDTGRFALCLYDKQTGKGTRVAVDPVKLAAWSELEAWLFKHKEKKDQNSQQILHQIKAAGPGILKCRSVQVRARYLKKHHKIGVMVCPICGEAYPREHGRICRACDGKTPYTGENAA